MLKKYVIANWKTNLNLSQIDNWLREFGNLMTFPCPAVEIIIASSYPYLNTILHAGYLCAGQDISVFDGGAHTGDVSAVQLKDFCKYCIIGHSERNEPISIVIQKRDQCLNNNITPIICFKNPVDSVKLTLFACAVERLKTYSDGVILVWEDSSSISIDGKYRDKDIKDIKSEVDTLRQTLSKKTILLYGGSVNSSNVSAIAGLSGVDGVLVGHASLEPEHFVKIIKGFME